MNIPSNRPTGKAARRNRAMHHCPDETTVQVPTDRAQEIISRPYTPSDIERAQHAIALFELQLDRPSVHVQIATLVQEGLPYIAEHHPRESRDIYLQPPMQSFFGNMLGLDKLISGEKLSQRAIHKDGTPKDYADQVQDALTMLQVCSKEATLAHYTSYYKFALELALMTEREPEPSIPQELVPSLDSNI